MRLNLKQLFSSRVFDDEKKTRMANLLSITILTLFLIAIVRSVLSIWASPEYLTIVLKANGALLVVLASVFFIMRAGRVRLACVVFTLSLWLGTAWLSYHYGGVSLGVYSFFVLVILASGLILGGNWALSYASISIVFGTLLLYLERQGLISPRLENPMEIFSTVTPSFITAAVFVYLYNRDISSALAQAYFNASQLANANEQLTREIAERKRFEEDLMIKSFTLDNLAEMIIWSNANGHIWNVNDTACIKLGHTRSELLSFSVADLDHEFSKEAWQKQWGELKCSGSLQFESSFKTKDGRVYPVEIIATYLNRNGLEYNCAIVRDITERKKLEHALRESEELFRTLCDSAPIGIFRAGRDGSIIYINPHWEKISGLSADESLRHGWLKAFHPDDHEIKRKIWLEAVAARHPCSLEYRVLTPQGTVVMIRMQAKPIMDHVGNCIGYVGIVEDITELRQAIQEKTRTQKLESLGVLAGGIAHDFNNILTAIVGNISLARMQLQYPEKVVQRMAEAENAAARAKDLTQQLLTFARGGEPVQKVVKVDSLLKESAIFALHGSAAKCKFVLADNLWPVEADEGQLSQVFNNLVINAVQAMSNGGEITIGAENDSYKIKGKRCVKISVSDSGIGIPEPYSQKIFDPYFTTKQEGSGLGLATCFSIITKHDGIITFESTMGKGTTFYVYLPALEQDRMADHNAEMDVVHGSGRILVMDDEEVVREIAQAMLIELGYMVECAKNGSEAVDIYRKRMEEGTPFSAVIMDLTIPGGMGGKEAINLLLKNDPNVKAIVSSGYSTDPVMASYRDYGFVAVLSKPYLLQEMSTILQDCLYSDMLQPSLFD
jgi:PAS domain S-box-containing protein